MERFDGMIECWDVSARLTGICYGRPGEEPRFDHATFIKRPNEHLFAVAHRVHEFATARFKVYQPKKVVIEAPIWAPARGEWDDEAKKFKLKSSPRATILLIGCATAVAAAAEPFKDIEVYEANLRTVRAYFIGAGNLKGDEAKKRTVARVEALGWNAPNVDCAEAAAIWAWMVNSVRPDLAPRVEPLFLGG